MFATYLIEKNIIKDSPKRIEWHNDMKNEKLIVEYAEHFKSELKHMCIHEISFHAKKFIEEDRLSYYDSTLKIIEECRQENFAIFIISGSPNFIVQHIADKFNIQGFGAMYGQDIHERFTGDITVPMFIAQEKNKIISRLVHELFTEEVWGVGDTLQDAISIGMACDRFFLQSPTQHTIQEVDKLGIEYEIIL